MLQERDAAEMQLNRMLARSITAPAAMVPAAAHRNSSSGSSGGNFLFPRRTSQQLFAAIPTTQQAAADAVQANPQEQYYREQLEESQVSEMCEREVRENQHRDWVTRAGGSLQALWGHGQLCMCGHVAGQAVNTTIHVAVAVPGISGALPSLVLCYDFTSHLCRPSWLHWKTS